MIGPQTKVALDIIGALAVVVQQALQQGRDVTQEELAQASSALGTLIADTDAKIKGKWG